MELRDKKICVTILVCMTIAYTVQSALLLFNQEQLRDDIHLLRSEVDGHSEDVYTLMRSDSARLYTIMDTQIRTLHYAKPHTKPVWACPECTEIHDRAKKEGSVSTFHLKKKSAQ
jgi:hypothetical protein